LPGPSPVDGFDWMNLILMLAYTIVPVGLAVFFGFRRMSDQSISLITQQWGGGESRAARQMIRRYLERGRRYRAMGFTLGWSAPAVSVLLRGSAYPSESVVIGGLRPVAGLLAIMGAIALHEATYRIPVEYRSAPLARRKLTRYLPMWMIVTPVVVGAAASALVAWMVFAVGPEGAQEMILRQVVASVGTVAILIVSAFALHGIVVRRQNLVTDEELEADETSRGFGAEVVWRAATAAAFTTLGNVGWALDFVRDPAVGTWLPDWIMLLFAVSGLIGLGLTFAAAFPNAKRFRAVNREAVGS